MDLNEIMRVSVYVLADFIPMMLLAVIPFQLFMRHKKYVTVISFAVMYCVVVACRILALNNLSFATYSTVILILVYLILYRINFIAKFTKLLFVLLTLLNYGSFVGILHTYTANRFLADFARDQYSLASSGILFFYVAISYPFMLYMMVKKIRPLMSVENDNKIWSFLWLVPATSCLSYYYSLFANGGILKFSENFRNVLFAVVLNVGSLFVTYIVTNLVKESNDSMLLKTENYKLNLQNLQYENLRERMEETRRTRHDLRQIITVIQACLRDNDTERLKKYIAQYTATLPADTPITYCENYEVNALILYYADLCNSGGISLHIQAQYPAGCTIAEPDAVILLGNLLENAVDACKTVTNTKPSISLNIQSLDDRVIITLDNTYDGKIQKTEKGFLSSKGNRTGIGISTIQNIANKYNGFAKFEFDDTMFHSSILLQTSSADE